MTPAWRLPRHGYTSGAAEAFVARRLAAEHGASAAALHTLGGRYHPTPGATPEVVHPVAVGIDALGAAPRRLHWVPLAELVHDRSLLLDGHLRVVALRAAHALGVLGRRAAPAPSCGRRSH